MQTESHKTDRPKAKKSDNAIILILIAVLLFAALSYAVSRAIQTEDQEISTLQKVG